MASNLQRRLEKLQAKAPKSKDKYFFDPWATQRELWQEVSASEKERLWAIYQRCGPFAGPCITKRGDDGRWRVVMFNTKLGGCEYAVMSVLHEGGVKDFLAWAEATCTPDELEVLARIMQAKWDPEQLRDGDVEVLNGITPRLPKWRPGGGGGREVGTHQHNSGAPANPESW